MGSKGDQEAKSWVRVAQEPENVMTAASSIKIIFVKTQRKVPRMVRPRAHSVVAVSRIGFSWHATTTARDTEGTSNAC